MLFGSAFNTKVNQFKKHNLHIKHLFIINNNAIYYILIINFAAAISRGCFLDVATYNTAIHFYNQSHSSPFTRTLSRKSSPN